MSASNESQPPGPRKPAAGVPGWRALMATRISLARLLTRLLTRLIAPVVRRSGGEATSGGPQYEAPSQRTTARASVAPRRAALAGLRAPLSLQLGVVAVLALVVLPMATIGWLSLVHAGDLFGGLASAIVMDSITTTAGLMFGVGALTLLLGTATAWVVTMYRFPGHAWFDRLLVIPLAVPTYIAAYAYVELLDYSGPLQQAIRTLGGFTSARDYWFPDVRGVGGAIFIMSVVLYPYVYLTARASFVQQSVCALDVARALGRTPYGAFIAVALPLARPALAAGVALALMECLNDIGAVEYLGVRTMTASVYATWLQRADLGGAAQLAFAMLMVVALLFALERAARGRARFHNATERYRAIPLSHLQGVKAAGAMVLCALPILLGFVLPVIVLINGALVYADAASTQAFWAALGNSVMLAGLAALAALAAGLMLAYGRRLTGPGPLAIGVRLSGLGYAVPGTVLALGLLIPLAAFDNALDAWLRTTFDISTGLLLTGSLTALVLAYAVRFLAVSLGGIEAGLERISPNLDAAARTLGESALSTLRRVHLPLLLPSLGAAGLLVFVDVMKELPATLLLRPFNFDTLATQVYEAASLDEFDQGALGALAIVAVGLIPVLILQRVVAGRTGQGTLNLRSAHAR
ncbi:MAG: iron ABC transporter permease [Pseudomonadota bacterium]